jgi:hypothetical protein
MAFVHQHNHFGLHSLSRRQFLGAAAATAGALATGLRIPPVLADNDKLATVFPLPIPGGTQITFPDKFSTLVHHFPSTANNPSAPISEPSEITDFNGVVGLDQTVGTGVDNSGNTLSYKVDNGFMSGLYRGEDGRMHHGTFAFL